jgi:hypothetical protein
MHGFVTILFPPPIPRTSLNSHWRLSFWVRLTISIKPLLCGDQESPPQFPFHFVENLWTFGLPPSVVLPTPEYFVSTVLLGSPSLGWGFDGVKQTLLTALGPSRDGHVMQLVLQVRHVCRYFAYHDVLVCRELLGSSTESRAIPDVSGVHVAHIFIVLLTPPYVVICLLFLTPPVHLVIAI